MAFSCEVSFILTEHGDRTDNCTLLFLFQNCFIWTLPKFFITPNIIFFPLQMVNFVLWVKLYWFWVCRFFSVTIYLHKWNLVYISILKKDMKNNIICGRRRNHRSSRMCHFPPLPFELSVNLFCAYCVLLSVFFLRMQFSWKTTSPALYKQLWLSPPIKHIAGCLLNIQWVAGYCWYAKLRLCGECCPA